MRRSRARYARVGGGCGERTGLANFPDGGVAAALAITPDAVVGGDNVGFDAVIVNAFERLADIADQSKHPEFAFLEKNFAGQIGADQDDGNLFGHASASAHDLRWPGECHRENAWGPI